VDLGWAVSTAAVLTGPSLANRDLIYLGVSNDGDSVSIEQPGRALPAPYLNIAMSSRTIGSEDRRQFALLTGQWNFPALLQRIVVGPEQLGNRSGGHLLGDHDGVSLWLCPTLIATPGLGLG
jgi:hypothetical protein